MTPKTRKRRIERKIVEFLISGKGINRICKELHVGKRRVRELREQARVMGYLGGGVALPCFPETFGKGSLCFWIILRFVFTQMRLKEPNAQQSSEGIITSDPKI